MKIRYPNGIKTQEKYLNTVVWGCSDQREIFSEELIKLPAYIVVSRLAYIIADFNSVESLTQSLVLSWNYFISNPNLDLSSLSLHLSFKQILYYVQKNESLITNDLSIHDVTLDIQPELKEVYLDFVSNMTISVVNSILKETMSYKQEKMYSMRRSSIFYQDPEISNVSSQMTLK